MRPLVEVALWKLFRPRACVRHTLVGLNRGTRAWTTIRIVRLRDTAVALLEASAIAIGISTPSTPLTVNGCLSLALRHVTCIIRRLTAVTNINVLHGPRMIMTATAAATATATVVEGSATSVA